MRFVARMLEIAIFIVVVLMMAAVSVIYFNQHRIVVAVLATIGNQTGVDIIPSGSHITISDHLIVDLDNPRVMSGGNEVVGADHVRAVVNFHALLTHGLPLRELDLEGPLLTLPVDANAAGAGPLPRPGRELIDETMHRLGDLARISRKLVVSGLTLRDRNGMLLLHDASLTASHRRVAPELWNVDFIADCEFPRLRGARAAGNFKLGEGGLLSPTQVLQGAFWFWQLPLQHLTIGNVEADGQSHGEIRFSIARDAVIDGVATVGLKALTVRSPELSSPLELGDYAMEARFTTSSDEVAISSAKLTHDGNAIVAARASIQKPYDSNPQIAVGIAQLKLAWKDVLASVRRLKRIPPELQTAVRQVKAGELEVSMASVDAPLAALESTSLEAILAKLSLNATLSEVSFAPPPGTGLPDVSDASVQIHFAQRTLSLLQGSAKIGDSELHDINAKLDLGKHLDELAYELSMKAEVDLADLRPATMRLLDQFNVNERDRLQDVRGGADISLDASGVLRKNALTRPDKYLVMIEPRSVTIGFRGAPGPIGVSAGAVIIQPDVIRLDKLIAHATGGTADFNGELRIRAGGVQTPGLKIAMHQMPIDRWLEGVVDPDDFSATGNVGGEVVITGDRRDGFLANGKITLQSGRIQLGFLRSPMIVHPAILVIRGRTLTVSMPAAELEKSPIDFTVTVPDIHNPSIRIDANIGKFDVEVMKFVRLPWMPPSTTHPPKIPISGHIDAREANLETFEMKNAKTDFKYSNGDWSVDNLTASSYGGRLAINIVGRRPDDWIRMFGKFENLNVASLFLVDRNVTRAPMSGHLDLTGDLWADTDSDFFATMAGTAILKMRDGNLDKFPLLSRMLELIDLRSWLTANVPDPRVSGLKFRTVNADFKGSAGRFYTDDLVLDGPAIDIVASGNVNLGDSTLDMKIGMIPFNTVNWALSHIPLVGKNVAGSTKSIISAYFNARGPIANPRVTPAPITSVAEIFKKTLGLPINLIKPDTIK
jgi:hypothetical protein